MSHNTKEFDIAYKWLDENVDSRFWDIPLAKKLERLLILIQPLPMERSAVEELIKKQTRISEAEMILGVLKGAVEYRGALELRDWLSRHIEDLKEPM